MATNIPAGVEPGTTLVPGARKLRSIIVERGLTDPQAAAELEMSLTYLRQICRGQAEPALKVQRRIALWSRPRQGKGFGAPVIGLADWLTDEDRALLAGAPS